VATKLRMCKAKSIDYRSSYQISLQLKTQSFILPDGSVGVTSASCPGIALVHRG